MRAFTVGAAGRWVAALAVLSGIATLCGTVGCTSGVTGESVAAAAPAAAPADDAADSTPAANSAQAAPAAGATLSTTPAEQAPQTRTAAKPIVREYAEGVPPVLLSAGHSELCKVNVGDAFPALELAKLGGGNATIESLAGAKATVVLLWTADRWMSEMALRDLANLKLPEGAAAVGVAVRVPADAAGNLVSKTGAKFTQLVDDQGKTSAEVGEGALPRIYVLDGSRRITWFDIEYSESSYRELQQTLSALAK